MVADLQPSFAAEQLQLHLQQRPCGKAECQLLLHGRPRWSNVSVRVLGPAPYMPAVQPSTLAACANLWWWSATLWSLSAPPSCLEPHLGRGAHRLSRACYDACCLLCSLERQWQAAPSSLAASADVAVSASRRSQAASHQLHAVAW